MNENNEVTNDDLKVEEVPEIEEIPSENDEINDEIQIIEDTKESQEENNELEKTNENENSNNVEESKEREEVNKESGDNEVVETETSNEINNSTEIKDSTEESPLEETNEEATKESSEVKIEEPIDIDATVLTNEEIKNVNNDMITAPQENVELPKIEAEVITPINESKSIEKTKEKKKKHPVKIIINIFIWIVVLGWAGILVFDFINVISEKEPMFCLEKSTEKTSDGTIDKCEGVGYNVYKYDYGSIKYIEFVPFWSKPKTLEQLQK